MGKILVFIYEQMADFEIIFALHLLGADAGKEIVTIAFENKPLKSKSGVIYNPHKTVSDALRDEVEGLIIPGGWNEEIREELMKLIIDIHNKEGLLAAICAGPRFLAKAGVLKNVKYTTSMKEWTDEHRVRFGEDDPFPRDTFVNDRVVRDGNIITAQGIAFVDFAVEILQYFNLFEGPEDRREFIHMMTSVK